MLSVDKENQTARIRWSTSGYERTIPASGETLQSMQEKRKRKSKYDLFEEENQLLSVIGLSKLNKLSKFDADGEEILPKKYKKSKLNENAYNPRVLKAGMLSVEIVRAAERTCALSLRPHAAALKPFLSAKIHTQLVNGTLCSLPTVAATVTASTTATAAVTAATSSSSSSSSSSAAIAPPALALQPLEQHYQQHQGGLVESASCSALAAHLTAATALGGSGGTTANGDTTSSPAPTTAMDTATAVTVSSVDMKSERIESSTHFASASTMIKNEADSQQLPLPASAAASAPPLPFTAVPSTIHATLREYQIKGVEWLVDRYDKCINCILADEMGLGECEVMCVCSVLFVKL